MINILDALKAKHPEATGDTIGEVIATMESGGGGGAGYDKTETPVYWANEQTITVVIREMSDPEDPNYDATNYTGNSDNIANVDYGTEGVCVIDGVTYKAYKRSEYLGYVHNYIAVMDGETTILKLDANGIENVGGFFHEEGTHTISAYYIAATIVPTEDFVAAASQIGNIVSLGQIPYPLVATGIQVYKGSNISIPFQFEVTTETFPAGTNAIQIRYLDPITAGGSTTAILIPFGGFTYIDEEETSYNLDFFNLGEEVASATLNAYVECFKINF